MRFPVQKGRSKAGLEARRGECPVCEGPLSGEPGSFAFLNGGALRKLAKDHAAPAPDLIGFLSLGYHGAHGPGTNESSGAITVADDVPMGQFEYYFCSTPCLRGFLNLAVDALERRISEGGG
jgi:hypothetical protein